MQRTSHAKSGERCCTCTRRACAIATSSQKTCCSAPSTRTGSKSQSARAFRHSNLWARSALRKKVPRQWRFAFALGSFGLAAFCGGAHPPMVEMVGTVAYAAPEVLTAGEKNAYSCEPGRTANPPNA
eukprot:5892614-Prymnesium_polylepis.1